jgi:opacity protein-like surface antigen
MIRSILGYTLLGAAALTAATSAHAQEDDDNKGFYGVARVGASISPQSKLDPDGAPAGSTFDEKTKYKTGVTGELGGGYDFGMFRIEQTAGYTSNSLNVQDAQRGGFAAAGRTRSFTVGVSGYVDIPMGRMITPYLGAGIGAARVDANLSRVDNATGTGSSYSGKDWGLQWHADTGIGVRVARKTTVELGGRYTQTSGLKFAGQSDGAATSYQPKLRSLSAMLGIRQNF